jgi:hypothetical protein
MIDSQHLAASVFLWGVGLFFGVVYALPLLVRPLHWARAFGWRLPEERALAVYFGRCLGALALAVVVPILRAAPHPADAVVLFEVIIGAAALLCAVHIWGAIRGEQPWLETAEIILYAGAAGAAIWVRADLT